MEAARPPLELLPDLPVEEPLDGTKAKLAGGPTAAPTATAAPVAAEATAKAGAGAEASKVTDSTGLNFVDPEMFLAPGQSTSAIPVVNAAPDAKIPEAPAELELEDPVVDEMLTSPPPPAAPSAAAPTLAPAAPAAPPAAEAAAVREAARVPIARTASLTAAATKLAAAQKAPGKTSSSKSKFAPTGPAKPAAPATPAPPAASLAKDSATAAPASSARSSSKAAGPPASPPAAAAKLDAPSLASWASARSAAASAAKVAAAGSAAGNARSSSTKNATPGGTTSSATPAVSAPGISSAARASSVKPVSAAAPPAAASAPASATPAVSAPSNALPPAAAMDRDYIARNQVVERYLSGRLPIKGATEFERFCKEHPKFLDEIGMPERVNAGLRLLEASGKPEPWQESKTPAWQKPMVSLVLACGVAILCMALAVVWSGSASKSHRIDQLQRQASERALDPATSTREIRLMPSRSGASNAPAITIGGGGAVQLADFKIDESRSPYHVFRITIDRIDQGRVGVINNIAKDSNGHLRIALNSSALGPGNYMLTLEGLDWRGEPQPDSWVTIGIAH